MVGSHKLPPEPRNEHITHSRFRQLWAQQLVMIPEGSWSFAGVSLHSSQPHFCTLSCLENPWLLPEGCSEPPVQPRQCQRRGQTPLPPHSKFILFCSTQSQRPGEKERDLLMNHAEKMSKLLHSGPFLTTFPGLFLMVPVDPDKKCHH